MLYSTFACPFLVRYNVVFSTGAVPALAIVNALFGADKPTFLAKTLYQTVCCVLSCIPEVISHVAPIKYKMAVELLVGQ